MLEMLNDPGELANHILLMGVKDLRRLEFLDRLPMPMGYSTARSIAGHICNRMAASTYCFSNSLSTRVNIRTWECGAPEALGRRQYDELPEDEKDNYRRINTFSLPDLILQKLVAGAVSAKVEALLSDGCVAYRKNLGHGIAVRDVSKFSSSGKYWVVRLDVKSFNETVHHDVLRRMLASKIYPLLSKDERRIVRGTVEALCGYGARVTGRRDRGLVVGSPLTPVLTNLYLSPLDAFLDSRKIPFVRYGDDLAAFCSSRDEARTVLSKLRGLLDRRLKQKTSSSRNRISAMDMFKGLSGRRKTCIVPPGEDFDFVGFNFRGAEIRLRHETYHRIKRRIEKLTHIRGGRIIRNIKEKGNYLYGSVIIDEASDLQEPMPSVYYLFRLIAGVNRLLGFRYAQPLGTLRYGTKPKMKFYPEFSLPFRLLAMVPQGLLKEQFQRLDKYLRRRTRAFRSSFGVYDNYAARKKDCVIEVDLRKMGIMTFKDVVNRFYVQARREDVKSPPG